MKSSGGYYDSPSKNTYSPAPGDSPSKGKSKRNRPIVPSTIYQLNTAVQPNSDSDSFMFDNQAVSQVSIVGQIMSENVQMTTLTYSVDDGTGWIDVRVYVDPAAQEDYVHQVSKDWLQGKYVRVSGTLRSFAKKRSLVAQRLIPVEDHNELVAHQLEVIHAHLLRTKGSSGGKATASSFSSGQFKASTTTSTASASSSSSAFTNPYAQQKPAMQHTDSGFTDLQNQIMVALAQYGNDVDGLSVTAFTTHIPKYSEHDIRNALSFLMDEGHLFTTIDEEHYAATGEDF